MFGHFLQHFNFEGDWVLQVYLFVSAYFCFGHLEVIQRRIPALCTPRSVVSTS